MSNRLAPRELFSGAIVALGVAVVLSGLMGLSSADSLETTNWALLALVTTGLRIRAPHTSNQHVSLNFVFVLLSIVHLSFEETVLLAGATTAIQIAIHLHRGTFGDRAGSALFLIASPILAAAISHEVFYSQWLVAFDLGLFPKLMITATMLFAGNVFPVAVMQAISAKTPLGRVWREFSLWAFPIYLSGAAVAGLVHLGLGRMGNANIVALLLPVAFVFYFASHFFMGRLSRQKNELESMAALQERTIEALALAIESKDQSAEEHLRRLRLYCVEMGSELGLRGESMEALRAGALLHDIGKLAVPDHILSKNGRLTREEFEKVKIHPVVGAQILERVEFPYPVAEVVLHHHEKWDGTGYPKGLKQEEIPIGSRILALVDCFDAMIEGRQYRTAVPVKDALTHVVAESGKSFDPRLVEILVHNYAAWEEKMREPVVGIGRPRPGKVSSVEAANSGERPEFCDTILAAGREEQVMLDLARLLGNSLLIEEAFSVLSKGLSQLVRFDLIALYVPTSEGQQLEVRYVQGNFSTAMRAKPIAYGQGIVGWVAQNERPLVNGTPTEELGLAAAGHRATAASSGAAPLGSLRPAAPGMRSAGSAIAVPLRASQGLAGVLMLCRSHPKGFSTDHLRILQMLTAKLASVVENAAHYQTASSSASTDFLTGLPNARSLALHLEGEIARARRSEVPLSILVTDLDGFKAVNDLFGHLEGNRVLCAVAKALRDSCREYDYVARLGGDEFVIVLPGLNGADLQSRIELFDRLVRTASFEVCPQTPVGLSAGIAQYPRDGADPAALLAAADGKMYQAKSARKGRNAAHSARGFAFDSHELGIR